MTAHGRILVVEDDDALRSTLAELLEAEGFEVSCAENGADALGKLAHERPPNVILLDLAMPVMDGWSFRRLQREDPRLAAVPTIVLSASLSPDAASLDALAADAFLPKPFDLDHLVETVRRLC